MRQPPNGMGAGLANAAWVAPAVFLAVYAWSLTFGFVWDDQFELRGDFASAVERLKVHFRPLYYFSFALTNPWFDAPYQHRLINLALLAGAAFFATRAAIHYRVAPASLLAVAIFLHPTYVYPATWISQRNDGLLLLFLFLAMCNVERLRGLGYLLLSDVAKTPWVLQNIWYAMQRWRAGPPRWPVIVALLAMPLVVGQALLFWGMVESGATSPMTQMSASGAGAVVFTLLVRLAKLFEAVVLIHVPVQAFYGAVPLVVLVLIGLTYVVTWTVLLVHVLRKGRWRRPGWHFLLLAVLMSLPFVANTDPRVFGPAIPFYFFFWAALAGDSRLLRVSLGLIAVLNLCGLLLNYRISDTGVFELAAELDYKLCGQHEMQFPMERWRCDRAQLAHQIVRAVNDALR